MLLWKKAPIRGAQQSTPMYPMVQQGGKGGEAEEEGKAGLV